jgi:DNA-binding NtrC family response regulator
MKSSQFPLDCVLIVDDEENILESYSHILLLKGINNVLRCQDSRRVLDILKENEIDVLLLDLVMPYLSGRELLPIIKRDYPNLPIIIITGIDEIFTAVECMQTGAFDYLVKPVENSKLIGSVLRALEIQELREENRTLKRHFLASELEHPEVFSEIITNNAKMRSLFIYIESISKTTQPVLITGETGVGKEMIAGAIHTLSGRKGEYIRVNVAGLDDNMFSDTLFGHRKGAFTGALESRKGLIEKASRGTFFLDEIGELSSISQVKLLRLLELQEYFPLGSDIGRKSDARIVVATNRNLDELLDTGRFRKDLYYRLSIHEFEIPPLRSRMKDMPLLVDSFLVEACQEMGKKKPDLPHELYALLETYHFPGNIRELKSMVFDAVSRHKSGIFSLESFKAVIGRRNISIPKISSKSSIIFTHVLPTLKEATELLIKEALKRSDNQAIAAHLLGISTAALSKRLMRAKGKYK